MNKLHNIKYHKYHHKFYRKNNLKDLVEILSIAINKENKSVLVFIINRWERYHLKISVDNCYIINNSNQLNHINFLIEEAKYIINKENRE